jgi:23S rRNA pseudouridine2605 synthase
MTTPIRLQRVLARAGLASRRGAEELIAAGRVSVNGVVATIGQSVDPERDKILVDGKPIKVTSSDPIWIVLHKPAAVMTTRRDPRGRKTVFDLVDDIPGLTYVGRLDFMTEGLLLLTTDGAAAHALTHPSSEIERTYIATVRGDVRTAVQLARRGVELEDGIVRPLHVAVRPLPERRRYAFEVTITEGRNREVRRLCDAIGLTVERLVRTQFGPVRLGRLPVGESRGLTQKELTLITALTKAAQERRRSTLSSEKHARLSTRSIRSRRSQ